MMPSSALPILDVAGARQRLGETPAIVAALCGGWSDDLWRVNEGPSTWSAREVLCHLIHCEDDNWIPRMRQILDGGGREPFRPLAREKGLESYGHEPGARLLQLFADRRARSLETLDGWTIRDGTMRQTGTHPEFGTVTLEQLLATWVTPRLRARRADRARGREALRAMGGSVARVHERVSRGRRAQSLSRSRLRI